MKSIKKCSGYHCSHPLVFDYDHQGRTQFSFSDSVVDTGGICADSVKPGSNRFGRCDSPAGAGKQKKYSSQFDGTGNYGTIQYADANGDGHLDICFRSDRDGVRCQLNDGNNQFPENDVIKGTENICDDSGEHLSDQCDNPENYLSIKFIDFNKDGKADVVFRGDTYGVTIIPNLNGTFDYSKKLVTAMCERGTLCDNTTQKTSNNYFTVRYPDLNGDGIPDICYRGDGEGIICALSLGIHPANKTPLYTKEFTARVKAKKVDQLEFPPIDTGRITDNYLSENEEEICVLGTDALEGYIPMSMKVSGAYTSSSPTRIDRVGKTLSGDYISVTMDARPDTKSNWSNRLNKRFTKKYWEGCNPDTIHFMDYDNDGLDDLIFLDSNNRHAQVFRSTGNNQGGGKGSILEPYDHHGNFGNLKEDKEFLKTTHYNYRGFPRSYIINSAVLEHWSKNEFKEYLNPSKLPTMLARRDADINGDGLIDKIGISSDNRIYYELSEIWSQHSSIGNGFIDFCTSEGPENCNKETMKSIQFVDFNNDRLPDLVYRSRKGIRIRYNTGVYGNQQEKIVKVDNGFGLVTNVKYKKFHGRVDYSTSTRSSTPIGTKYRYVVDEVTTNTIGGASKLKYEYGNAKRDAIRNKVNGFEWVSITKSVKTPEGLFQPIIRTHNTYNASSSYVGGNLLKQERFALSLNTRFPGVFSEDEKLISRTTNEWGLFIDEGRFTNKGGFTYRQDLFKTGIIKTTTEDFGWLGNISEGRLQAGQTWGPISKVVQESDYGLEPLDAEPRHGNHIKLFQLPTLGDTPIVLEQKQGLRVEHDLVNSKTHTIKTENEFYPGNRSRLKQSRVTKTYQRLDGTEEQSVKTSAWEYYPNGQMKKEIVEPGDALALTTEYRYDPTHGQRTEVIVSGAGLGEVKTHYEYDDWLRVTKVTNSLGHSVTTEYEDAHGLPSKVMDTNGRASETKYDDFGRVKEVISPEGIQTFTEYLLSKDEEPGTQYKVRTWDNLGSESIRYHAPTGQVVLTKTKGFDGKWIEARTQYDAYSQVKRTQRPAYSDDAERHWDEVVKRNYLGIATEAKNAAGHVSRVRGTARYLEETNVKGQLKTKVMDMKGNLHKVFDHHGNELQYLYSPDGQLLELKDVAGNHSTKIEYDQYGNKLKINDPDKGITTFAYNAAGQQILSEQAGIKVCFQYDVLGRMVKRFERYQGSKEQALNQCAGNATGTITEWVYDTAPLGEGAQAKGLLHRVFDNKGYNNQFEYDAKARVVKSTLTIKGKTYVESYTYDEYGRAKTHTFPSGFQTANEYEGGFLKAVKNATNDKAYWELGAMSATGQITHQTLGNGLNISHRFDPVTGFLLSQGANLNGTNEAGEMTSTSVQAMSYNYDTLGNLLSREDLRARLKETLSYDGLNRLVKAEVFQGGNMAAPILTDTVSYFENGNIRTKSGVGEYAYGQQQEGCSNTPGPHALTQVTSPQGVRKYCYDNRGNMTQDGARKITYGGVHEKPTRMETLSGNTYVEFEYGPDYGRYYRKDVEREDVSETYYAGSGYEEVYADGNVLKKHYIGDQVVEVHRYEGDELTEQNTRYLLKDQLGSVTAVTDEAGNLIERHHYDAWGKKRSLDWRNISGLADADAETLINLELNPANDSLTENVQAKRNSLTNHAFTGHELIESLGLIHMGGRVYDPHLGRFLSADPFVQAPTNTQSLNRYSYVFNNPMSYTDPSGYLAILGFEVGGWVGQVADRIGFHLAEFDYWMHTDESGGAQAFRTAVIVTACYYGGAPGCIAANGYMTYWMTGDLRQGIKAAAIAGASAAISGAIGEAAHLKQITANQAIVAHGVSQGTLAVVGQGSFSWQTFGRGFASGVAGSVAPGSTESVGADIFLAGMYGGIVSRIAGGSFNDGFISAAMVRMFNHHGDYQDAYASDCSPGTPGCARVGTNPDGTDRYRLQGADPSWGPLDVVTGVVGLVRGVAVGAANFARTGFTNLRALIFGPSCFAAGTRIRTREGYVAIEDIKQGDWVASKDEKTGDVKWNVVTKTFEYQNKPLLNIFFSNSLGTEVKVEVTPEHPFYVKYKGWVEAGQLIISDEVETIDGSPLKVSSISTKAGLHTVYNFEVDSYHTYFVSEVDLWVHNSCLPQISKAINSNMPHAVERALQRNIFPDAKSAAEGFKNLSANISKNGWPKGTIRDTARADRVLVPIGNGGYAVYQVGKNGSAKLKTVLNQR